MTHPYIDLHTHTSRSDGILSPEALVREAEQAGIGILAITDHNRPAELATLQAARPELRLIQGSELSTLYTDAGGREHEVHVVALGFDPEHPAMQALFRQNQPDRRPYIGQILARLGALGIDVGSYETLQEAAGGSTHFGRMQIATEMKNRGWVASVSEAFDVYLGAHGQRKAYVPNPLRYVTTEEAVTAVTAAGGIPVLAHLYYYQLPEEEELRLLRHFRAWAGSRAAMEVEYGQYTRAQRDRLGQLAQEYGLLRSCASDYHGHGEDETLRHGFLAESCRPLLEMLGLQA